MSRPGKGRGPVGRAVQISKAMSLLLRHAAEKEGVKIDSQGYANVADVLAWRKLKSLKVTFAEIVSAVDTSDKKRFALLYNPIIADGATHRESTAEPQAAESEDPFAATSQALEIAKSNKDVEPSHYLIRATQGHSLKTVEAAKLLKQIVLEDDPKAGKDDATVTTKVPDTVVHGTFHGAWQQILDAGGLKPMNRNHTHFATGPVLSDVMPDGPEGTTLVKTCNGKARSVISGMRKDAQILVYIDIRAALAAGIKFWVSENGVILSEGIDTDVNGTRTKVIPLKFFDTVVEKEKGTGVLMRKGKPTMETPEWMKNAPVPHGKKRGPWDPSINVADSKVSALGRCSSATFKLKSLAASLLLPATVEDDPAASESQSCLPKHGLLIE
ncbi:hypothetical protein KEM54_005864 [Ascosphaera aggregata]|nr:hypothetical protein KEM54_005864 [Ascosphaera aggregata]